MLLYSSTRRMSECRDLTLVVDADDRFRHFAMRALRSLGRAAIGVASAGEAVRWLDENRAPSLITLDVAMADGFALIHKARRHAKAASVPIVCASSLVEVDDHLQALRAGADVFLPKPIAPDVYVEEAARLLRAGTHGRFVVHGWIDSRRM